MDKTLTLITAAGGIVLFIIIWSLKSLFGGKKDGDSSYYPEKKKSALDDKENKVPAFSEKQSKDYPYIAYNWVKPEGSSLSKLNLIYLSEPIGSLWAADASMPKPGMVFLVKDDEKGNLVPYDPREIAMNEDERPELAYDATHVKDKVKAFYASPIGLWDKINTTFMYVACFLMFILLLVGFDKL